MKPGVPPPERLASLRFRLVLLGVGLVACRGEASQTAGRVSCGSEQEGGSCSSVEDTGGPLVGTTYDEVSDALIEGTVEGMCGQGGSSEDTWQLCVIDHDGEAVVAATAGPAGSRAVVAGSGRSVPLERGSGIGQRLEEAAEDLAFEILDRSGAGIGSFGSSP